MRTVRASRLVATLVVFSLVALPAVGFSSDTVVATVPVGRDPFALAVDPVTHHVYVANYGNDNVSVIDAVTDGVEATITMPLPPGAAGAFPIAVVTDPLGGRTYVGNFWSSVVSVIDNATSSRIATIAPPTVHGSGIRALAFDGSGDTPKVYAAHYGMDFVSVIDAAASTITTNIPVGEAPRSLAVFASGVRHRVYVANRYSDDVSIIDGATDSVVATVQTGVAPKVVAVDPDRGFAYVSSTGSDNVTVIDDSDAATATIGVGDNPIGIGVDASRRRVFVANYYSNNVSVIDADTLSVVATVATGPNPYSVAVDQSAGKAFVSCFGGDSVTVIDPTLATVSVPVGDQPYGLGIDEGLAVHKTFVGNWGSDDVSVIDPAEGSGGPVTVTVDPMPADATSSVTPVLTGTASSTREPYGSDIVAVFYRLDDEVAWRRAEIVSGEGTASVRWRTAPGTLALGSHTVYIAAMDQTLATAVSSDGGASGASTALGSPGSYGFSVLPEPTIAGVVTGLAGEPLERMVVSAYDANTHAFVKAVFSGADGRYVLSRVPAGSYHLRFLTASGATVGSYPYYSLKRAVSEATTLTVAAGETATADQRMQTAAPPAVTGLAGTVTNGAAPCTGIVVSAFDASTNAYVKGVFTNGVGGYSLPLPSGTYHLRFTNTTPSSLSQYYDHKTTIDNASVVTVGASGMTTVSADLAPLPPPVTQAIMGGIMNGGLPCAGIVVSAFNASTYAYVKGVFTNAIGNYSITLPPGTYRLRFTGTTPSSLSQYYDHAVTIDGATPVTLAGGVDAVVNSDLAP